MAIPKKTLLRIRTAYELGLPVAGIAKRFQVSLRIIQLHAKNDGWKYAKNAQTFTQEVHAVEHAKNVERVAQEGFDRARKISENFINSTNAILYIASKEISKGAQDPEYAIDFEKLKACRIATEIFCMIHDGQRKALGLIEPPQTQININAQITVYERIE